MNEYQRWLIAFRRNTYTTCGDVINNLDAIERFDHTCIHISHISVDSDRPLAAKLNGAQNKRGDSIKLSVVGLILDGVFLTIVDTPPAADPLTVSQENQFTVEVDEHGRFTIVGIDQ